MILRAATPQAWVEAAAARWPELLADHANCEKKAASTALALLFAYPEDRLLALRMARLAREELRHFEQVDRMMRELGVPVRRLAPGRYAGALRRELSTQEPQRKVDLMLCGALIEARSCERFERVAARLPQPLDTFYADLAVAERRHETLYLELALAAARESGLAEEAARQHVQQRLAAIATREAQLATEPDSQFRFHSGPPEEGA